MNVWNCGSPSSIDTHGNLSCAQMCSAGCSDPGSSSVANVKSTSRARAACRYVNVVPHRPQKPRTTFGDDANSRNSPAVTRKPSRSTVPHATGLAPAARRQLSQ